MMTDPPHCWQPESHWRWHILWMMIDSPLYLLPTRISLKILNLGFRLDMGRWLTPYYHWPVISLINFKLKISAWTWKDDWSPAILPTSNSVWIWNLRFSLDMERWLIPPSYLPTRNSLKILNLRFSLDMERWLTPCITDQNLTENFKFKLQPGHGKMNGPQQYCQPVTQCEFEI